MTKTEFSPAELVDMSADYFASNPDAEFLVAVVGSGTFYRPEREGYAEHDAAVANTTTRRVYRHELPAAPGAPASLVEVEGAVLNPVFPPVVAELAAALAACGEVTHLKMAQGIYVSLLVMAGKDCAEALTRQTMEYMEAEAFQLLAAGGTYQVLPPAPAPEVSLLAEAVRDAQLFVFPAPSPVPAEVPPADAPSTDQAPADAGITSADQAPADAGITSADQAPAAAPAKAKAAPKKKASTVANAS